jgi:hypothetical protein
MTMESKHVNIERGVLWFERADLTSTESDAAIVGLVVKYAVLDNNGWQIGHQPRERVAQQTCYFPTGRLLGCTRAK